MGFFDQDVDAGFEKVAADIGVDGGGRGDDGGVDLAGEVARVGERDGLVAGGGFVGAGGVDIDDGGEMRARGFVDHAAVVLTESSGADDGYSRL